MPLDELARHIALDNMQAEERRQQEAQQRFKAKFKQRK